MLRFTINSTVVAAAILAVSTLVAADGYSAYDNGYPTYGTYPIQSVYSSHGGYNSACPHDYSYYNHGHNHGYDYRPDCRYGYSSMYEPGYGSSCGHGHSSKHHDKDDHKDDHKHDDKYSFNHNPKYAGNKDDHKHSDKDDHKYQTQYTPSY